MSTTKTLRCPPGTLTVGDLRDFLTGEDPEAKVILKSEYPDRPGEIGQVTVTVTYMQRPKEQA